MKPLLFTFIVYLILGSLMPNADFTQLKRFTELRSHYLDHISEAGEGEQKPSFWLFVQLHFISPSEHQDADHEEDHRKLPLQTFDFSLNFLVFLMQEDSSYPVFKDNNPQGLEMSYILAKGFPTSVFHPPTRS